jgi:hypothetical protein
MTKRNWPAGFGLLAISEPPREWEGPANALVDRLMDCHDVDMDDASIQALVDAVKENYTRWHADDLAERRGDDSQA